MKRESILALCLLVCLSAGCKAQPSPTLAAEPVRFGDGTPVLAEEEAWIAAYLAGETGRFHPDSVALKMDYSARMVMGDSLVKRLIDQDELLVGTIIDQGDTIIRIRHASAFVRLEVQGIPEGETPLRMDLIPLSGELAETVNREAGRVDLVRGTLCRELPVPGAGDALWMALAPQDFSGSALALVVHGADGAFWSARIPGQNLEGGLAYRWTLTCVGPEPEETTLRATPLSQKSTGAETGEYSGITWISGDTYAVVSDNLPGGGLLQAKIALESDGNVRSVMMAKMPGTEAAKGRAPDAEGVAFANGKLYVSTEKQVISEYALDGKPTGKSFRIPKDMAGGKIIRNRGFEALTYSAETGLFWTTTEAPLPQDSFLPGLLRLQSFDGEGNPARRFFYQTEAPLKSDTGALAYVFGVPSIEALPDGSLLVMEREVYVPEGRFLDKFRSSFTRTQLFLVDPEHDTAGILRKRLLCSFRTGALDLANYEGMCLGPALSDGARPLVLIADSQNGSGGLTGEYVKVILLRGGGIEK